MTKEEIIEELNRLEILSDMVRKGQPIDFSEAIEVINYQENLKLERKKNSFVYKVKRWARGQE